MSNFFGSMKAKMLSMSLIAFMAMVALAGSAFATHDEVVDPEVPVVWDWVPHIIDIVVDFIGVMMEPPIVYFVVLALVGASVGIVKRILPSKSR